MFSTNCLPRNIQAHSNQYTPSPLSSSPLARSPSPLSPRCENLPTYTQTPKNQRYRVMSSPTPSTASRSRVNANASSIFTPQQLSPYTHSDNSSPSSPHSRAPASASSFSKRTTKPNPLLHGSSREEGRETRRKLFLKRVREGSEEKRWQNRGGDEEIMRVLWCGEERRRLEALRSINIEESEVNLDEIMADEMAVREEMELQARLQDMQDLEESTPYGQHQGTPEEPETVGFEARTGPATIPMLDEMAAKEQMAALTQHEGGGFLQHQHLQEQSLPTTFKSAQSGFGQQQEPLRPGSMYGSDDEEYDHLFQDFIEEEIRLSQQGQQGGGDQDMMDLS